MTVLISHFAPTLAPAARSHRGHSSVPLNAAFAVSTRLSLSAIAMPVRPRSA